MEAPAFKPSILDRAISAISPVAGMKRLAARQVLHQFSYDGARATTKRAQAPAQIAPNSFSVQRDRLQLLREATDLENNFAPAKTLNRKYAMYVAPQGYHAQTGDPQLDTDVEHYLNHLWFPNADVAGRADFFRLMEFGVIGMNRGGDYGWAYMRPGYEEGMSIDDAAQLPFAIQPVESDRIGGVYQNVVSEDYVSGVIVGQDGAKVGYRVFRRGMSAGQYMDPVDVPASQFVHYLDPMLVDMYRGVSKLDAACSQLRDLYEMIDLTKGKSKLAAALTVFTNSIGATSGSGAMDGYSSQLFDNQQSGMQQDILYGQINHLTAGQDIKFPSNESPGTSDQYLMNLLLKLVAMSYNLPFSFALDATALGGVSSRLESEQAKAEFERGQKVLAPHAHRIKNAALIDAIGKGLFPASVADKIGSGRWSYRPHPQPDIGKEANAAMNLYQNGLLNPMQYWTDDAQDPENVAKDMVRWAIIKRDAAAREGFTVEEVFGSGPAKPTNISQSETTTTDENGQPVESAAKAFAKRPKKTPAEAERAAIIRDLVDLLKEKLPTDQAVAAAYKIYDEGKTRSQLVAEVKARLKDKGTKKEASEFESWDESKVDRADDGKFGGGGGGSKSSSEGETKSTKPSKTEALKAKLEKLKAGNLERAKDLAETNARVQELHGKLVDQLKSNKSTDELKKTVADLGAKLAETEAHTKSIEAALANEDRISDKYGDDSDESKSAKEKTSKAAKNLRQNEPINPIKFAAVGERGGIKASPKAPKSDTPNKDPQGKDTAKGDASGKSGAKVTADQEKTLQNKADEFNEKESNTKNGRAALGALKSVFQRGLGAFATSHSPVVKSAEQWAFARVNAFLYLLKNGRPENAKYTTDFDLLPEKHPKATK
jgi:capsid protein